MDQHEIARGLLEEKISYPLPTFIKFGYSSRNVPRYWNSLSTHVTVGVPLVDDESL